MSDAFSRFYHEVYDQEELPSGTPHGWIQWKGTDVCMDLRCPCGHCGHVDADFFHYYRCPCGKQYAVGQVVKLIPLTDEQAAFATQHAGYDPFKTDNA